MKKNIWDTLKPALLMVAVHIIFAACNVFYKLAIHDGMSTIVITAYRLAFAAVTTIPIALIWERNKRPKMTWWVFLMTNISGFFGGFIFQNLFYGALIFTTATIVTAINNLTPVITFILAVSCGLEKLNWGRATGKAKVIGTLLGLSGATLLTFYKGVEFDIWPFAINLLDPTQSNQTGHVSNANELLGALFVVISCCGFSLWLIIQGKITEVYPPMSSIALMSIMGTIQCVVFGFIVERDLSQWKLGLDIRLLTVAFSGILASGVMNLAIAWVVQTKGPLFASAFHPLMLLFVAIVASMVLDEKLNLGSVLGGLVIVVGLYTLLWGKSKEAQKKIELEPSHVVEDSEATTPLLSPC